MRLQLIHVKLFLTYTDGNFLDIEGEATEGELDEIQRKLVEAAEDNMRTITIKGYNPDPSDDIPKLLPTIVSLNGLRAATIEIMPFVKGIKDE